MEGNNTSNQASNLEKLISEVQQVEPKEYTEANLRINEDKEIKIDVLSLPSRSEVHQTNKRTRIRLSKPMRRFIFVLLLMILLVGGSIYFFYHELIEMFTS